MEATTTISSIGGLVGRALGANIYNCYATGSIHINAGNNRERIGGLCGRFGATAGTYGETMEYCYSTIDVAGTTWIGGLVGQYYG
ncbi:MAG: hypothetical protein GWO10_17915, partial [candidate division Zixibacteria bacterium]|nr:hypothetical protein [Phycisphaerae bacterium]NIR65595.1 hypothetical protein [candidate division Zixibacteria bacterium]NIW46661.1 hypothetical protein [Gammaproteobacteria bacterium]NIW98525.1 hypothetical protein [Phycisphaerae bacterium]